jgi:excisionase family DNA binding protein
MTMAGVREKLLTASDLAALCEVDLKTIHNWVDRGRIAHFRTPGRHLRFRAADVAEFLRAWGYTVPRELSRASSRTALVVGSKETAAHVTRALGESMPVRHAAHPYDALILAGSDPADVYLVDLKEVTRDADVDALLEALHRASPQAAFVALAEDTAPVPSFVTRVGRADAHALRSLLAPEAAAAAAAVAAPSPAAQPVPAEEAPRGVAAGGSSR